MKPKTMILAGLAVVCGLGASYMTSRLLAERAPAEEEKVEILVAKRNLRVGEPLLKPQEMFEKKAVAKENEPPDAIKNFDDLKGKIMKQSRNKGDHILPANLRNANEGLDIPEGHFAMGMRVNLEGSAHGFATLPQSRVNIIQTMRGPNPKASISRILLENVLVLAADLKFNPDGELASPAQVVTFALKGEEVLKVSLAKELGILTLSLRKLNDTSHATVKVINGDQLDPDYKEKSIAKAEITPPVKVAPKVEKVEPKKKVEPKFTTGHYDIVNGAQFGDREVTRVHYRQMQDGSIYITRRELIESTRVGAKVRPSSAPEGNQGGDVAPNDF
ncbi:MAG: Flp pilus assembly protein CpaB [Planctomycetes bacterium]|jgi:pilus assembly protein CpaB|nr:Flp pilus assembly protein CpaB [Planctomycetota bacterium]